jgi:hypothetical protein
VGIWLTTRASASAQRKNLQRSIRARAAQDESSQAAAATGCSGTGKLPPGGMFGPAEQIG